MTEKASVLSLYRDVGRTPPAGVSWRFGRGLIREIERVEGQRSRYLLRMSPPLPEVLTVAGYVEVDVVREAL